MVLELILRVFPFMPILDLPLNPEAYINGDLQWADGSKAVLSETGIVNIKCDDEFNDMEF